MTENNPETTENIILTYEKAYKSISNDRKNYINLLNKMKKEAVAFLKTKRYWEGKYLWLENVAYFDDHIYIDENKKNVLHVSFVTHREDDDDPIELTFEEIDNITPFLEEEYNKYLKRINTNEEKRKQKRIKQLETELKNLKEE